MDRKQQKVRFIQILLKKNICNCLHFQRLQLIQFNVSIVSMSKTILFQTIQFSISTQFKDQNSSISSNLVCHKYTD